MTAKALLIRGALIACATLPLAGCLAVAATGAVVGAAGTVVGTGVKATGAVVGAVIPGGGDRKD
jgi:hypothetical protein